MRIGFLFNHDQVHQVAHSLPIALALRPHADVVLAATSDRLADEIVRLASAAGHPDVRPLRLSLDSPGSRLLANAFGRLAPIRKLLVYRDNLPFFRSLDALVVTERTSLLLKTRYGLHDLPIILADHGAGDRAIGFGRETADFDYILAAGPKIRDRLVAEAEVDPSRIAITGYPKFDLSPRGRVVPDFADPGRPTVLYNPHASPHLSSWYRLGRDVMDFFLASDRYNLIFAPHIMLFERRFVFSVDKLRAARAGRLDPKYARALNIHVDLGSPASTDSSYTEAADIYLGDVSSQIYEFLRRPRPALFIDAHQSEYRGNPDFAHWSAGPVVEGVRELGRALEETRRDHSELYAPVQRALFDYTFDIGSEPAGVRAARAILSFLTERA